MSGTKTSSEALTVFQDLKLGKIAKYVMFKLDDTLTEIQVDKISSKEATFEEMCDALPPNECRYVVYDAEYAKDSNGNPIEKLVIIAWAPDSAPVRQKMVYASAQTEAKRAFSGVNITIQATDRSECNMEEIAARCRRGF